MTMNRIATAIAKKRAEIAERIKSGAISQAKADETSQKLNMDFQEWSTLQELKSLAVAVGLLTVDEGMTVYRALGASPDALDCQDLATKAVLTTLLAQLLEARVKMRRPITAAEPISPRPAPRPKPAPAPPAAGPKPKPLPKPRPRK